jgi:CRP/FNR family transcriptional regulator
MYMSFEPFFRWSHAHQRLFLDVGQAATYRKNQLLVRADEENNWVFFLEKGLVKIGFLARDGSERILGYFLPGMTFAQSGSFFDLNDSGLEYEAIAGPAVVRRMPRDVFLQKLASETTVAKDYTDSLLRNQVYLIERVVYQGEKGVHTKCIAWLLFMAKYYGIAEGDAVKLAVPLTQEIVANFLHVTRESASSALRRLVRDGLITVEHKHITIVSLHKLRDLQR